MITDQELKNIVTANIGNPRALAQLAQQRGFSTADIARVSGFQPEQIAAHFQKSGVTLPTNPQAGMPNPAPGAGLPRPTLPGQASPTAVGAVAKPPMQPPMQPAPTPQTSPAQAVAPMKPVAPLAAASPMAPAKPMAPTQPLEADKAFASGFNTVRPR